MQPLFSISIPTYNRADGYLRRALSSAVAQRYPNLEILVSDNCSTDDTSGVVASFNDPRIRYVKHPQNLGHTGNFRFCVEAAQGTYVLVLHDDDEIDADFVETCMQAAAGRDSFGLIKTGVRIIDEDGVVTEEHPNQTSNSGDLYDFVHDWFGGKHALYMCCIVFHREKLLGAGGLASKRNLYDDVAAEIKLAGRFPRLELPAVKASFRRHGQNRGTYSKTVDWCEDSLYLVELMCELVPRKRDELRNEALLYFCKKNYIRAGRIPSLLDRWMAYRVVGRMFENVLSPGKMIYQSRIKPALGRLKRRVLGRPMR